MFQHSMNTMIHLRGVTHLEVKCGEVLVGAPSEEARSLLAGHGYVQTQHRALVHLTHAH
jgi:hypothetical protein